MGLGFKVVCEQQRGEVAPLMNDPDDDNGIARVARRNEEDHMPFESE
jgi:hypothetical protein